MELILKYITLGALAECPSTSQEESFHISLTLHIYYIIFFYKNQKRFFTQIFDFYNQDGFNIFTLLYQLSYVPRVGGTAGLEPTTRGTSSYYIIKRIAVPVFLFNGKDVWRKKVIRAYHFLYLTYILYHIFFEKSRKIFCSTSSNHRLKSFFRKYRL